MTITTIVPKPSPNGRVEAPWRVSGAEHENAVVVVAHALHLDQELGLDAARALTLSVRSRTAHRVNLVHEDDARLLLACNFKQRFHQSVGQESQFGC